MKTALLVLAAGLGSRFGGLKQMAALGPSGESILEYSAYDAVAVGFDELVFVVRRAMEEDFREKILPRLPLSLPTRLVFQEPDSMIGLPSPARSKPWGTGHALLCAETVMKTPFAVINADDWYGRESLRAVHDFLADSSADSPEYCMAAYRLRNTMSPHGAVARGICAVDGQGYLLGVEEHCAIVEGPGSSFVSTGPNGRQSRLGGDSLVSMNLWGFTPRVFGTGALLFREFLREHGSSPTAEFYLPALVDAAINRGQAKVRALPTEDTWFGVTWREDLDEARRRIARLVEGGFYRSDGDCPSSETRPRT